LADIVNNPSFRTRLRLGYSQFPSTDQAPAWNAGVEDVFVGRTGLTLSGDYQATMASALLEEQICVTMASLVATSTSRAGGGLSASKKRTGTRVSISVRACYWSYRGGAADISLTQSWVAPGTDEEVGLTTLSFGYAFTRNLRFYRHSKQNARQSKIVG